MSNKCLRCFFVMRINNIRNAHNQNAVIGKGVNRFLYVQCTFLIPLPHFSYICSNFLRFIHSLNSHRNRYSCINTFHQLFVICPRIQMILLLQVLNINKFVAGIDFSFYSYYRLSIHKTCTTKT